MEEPRIIINTTMTKEDYKRFLYIATFKRSKYIIPLLALLSLIGSLVISFNDGNFNFLRVIIIWIVFFILTIIVIMYNIERKNKQRVKTDKTGVFDSVNTLEFYNDKIVMENKQLKTAGELKYSEFHDIMETKDYFILYWTLKQASLIRKRIFDHLDEFRKLISSKFDKI